MVCLFAWEYHKETKRCKHFPCASQPSLFWLSYNQHSKSSSLQFFFICSVGLLLSSSCSAEHATYCRLKTLESFHFQTPAVLIPPRSLRAYRPAETGRKGRSHCVFFQGCTPHGTLHRCVRCKLHCDIKKGTYCSFLTIILAYCYSVN